MNLFNKVKNLANEAIDKGKEKSIDSLEKGKELANGTYGRVKEVVKQSVKINTDIAINIAIEQVTKPVTDSMDARRESADNLLDTVLTKSGVISKNINLKGFIFEQEQARTFNEMAAKEGISLRAIVDAPTGINGKGAPDIRIIDTDTGETLKSYQAKIGTKEYINKQIKEEKYTDGNTDAFVTDIDNYNIQNIKKTKTLEDELSTTDIDENYLDILDKLEESINIESQINFEEITAESFTVEQMQNIASNPKEFIDKLDSSANHEEVISGFISGIEIGVLFQSINESIKILAKFYNGENIPKEVISSALKNIMTTITSSAIRGTLIRVFEIILEKQMEDSGSLPLIIVSVAPIVYKTLLEYFKGEITLEECINRVGTEALSRGMMISLSIVFPPIGFTLMGISMVLLIWKEFNLEKEILNNYPQLEKVFMFVNKVDNQKSNLINDSKNKLEKFSLITVQSVSDTKELVKNSFVEKK